MSVHWGGRGPGHVSRRTKSAGGVPYASNDAQFGMNLTGFEYFSRARVYMNLATYGQWVLVSALDSFRGVGFKVAEPYVDRQTGEILSLPAGGLEKIMGLPRVAGTVVATWTGTAVAGVDVTVINCSNVSYPTANSIRFDMTVNSDRSNYTQKIRVTGGTLTGLDIREVGAGAQKFDPVRVDEMSQYGFIRFLNPQAGNYNWRLGYPMTATNRSRTGGSDLPNPVGAWNSTTVQMFVGASDCLTMKASLLPYDSAYYAAHLSPDYFGSNTANISVKINAPSGAGSITVTGFDVEITPAAGAGDAASVAAQIDGHSVAATLIGDSFATSGQGATLVGVVPKTNFPAGQDVHTGMSIEEMIALLRVTRKRGWVHIPINADTTWTTELATQIRDAGLPASCFPIVFEYANEPWNFSFPVARVLEAYAISQGDSAPSLLFKGQARKHIEHMAVIEAILSPSQYRRVVNVQRVSTAGASFLAAYPNLVAHTDAFCCTGYLGSYTANDTDKTLDIDMPAQMQVVLGQMEAHKAITDAAGIDLYVYEWGHHVQELGGNLSWLQELFRDTTGRWAFIYGMMMSEMKRRLGPDALMAHYMDIEGISAVQQFGMLEYDGMTPPSDRYIGHLRTVQNDPPSYIFPGDLPFEASGVRFIGYDLTWDVPPIRNAVAPTYDILRDGVVIESGSLSADGGDSIVYTQVEADDGSVLTLRVNLPAKGAWAARDYQSADDETTTAEPAYETEAEALFARWGTQPNDLSKAAVNAWFVAMKAGPLSSSNILAKLDCFYFLGMHTEADSKLNFVGNTLNLTEVGTVNFTAHVGMTPAGGTGDYLDIGVNVSALTQFTQNSATMMGRSLSQTTAGMIWSKVTSGGGNFYLVPYNSSGSPNAVIRVNASSQFSLASSVGDVAFGATRTGATTTKAFRGTTQIGTTNSTASEARVAEHAVIGKTNTATIRYAALGGGLTDNEYADLVNASDALVSAWVAANP